MIGLITILPETSSLFSQEGSAMLFRDTWFNVNYPWKRVFFWLSLIVRELNLCFCVFFMTSCWTLGHLFGFQLTLWRRSSLWWNFILFVRIDFKLDLFSTFLGWLEDFLALLQMFSMIQREVEVGLIRKSFSFLNLLNRSVDNLFFLDFLGSNFVSLHVIYNLLEPFEFWVLMAVIGDPDDWIWWSLLERRGVFLRREAIDVAEKAWLLTIMWGQIVP